MPSPTESVYLMRDAWYRVAVYVGGATRNGLPLDVETHRTWVRRISVSLAALSGGGCTVHAPATGCWRGVAEPTVLVEALVPYGVWRGTHPARAAFDACLQHFLAATCQDAVLVTAAYFAPNEVTFVTSHDGEGVVAP